MLQAQTTSQKVILVDDEGNFVDLGGSSSATSNNTSSSTLGTFSDPVVDVCTSTSQVALEADPDRDNFSFSNYSPTEIIHLTFKHDATLSDLSANPPVASNGIRIFPNTFYYPLNSTEAKARISIISENPAPYSIQIQKRA